MTDSVSDKTPVSRFWSKLGLVAEISRLLREQSSDRTTFELVLGRINTIIPFDAASLYLMNESDDNLDEVASFGKSVNILEFLRFGKGFGLAGWVAAKREPIYIRGRSPETDGVREHHDTVFILPLLVKDELVGVLCFSDHSPDAFNEQQRQLLQVVGDQVAISIERIFYQQKLEKQNRSLEQAQRELQAAQEQIIAREKLSAVAELAASVNHELNNPLSIIVGNAQMIELEAPDLSPAVAGRIQAIVEGARRISLITHKLLKIDRLVTEDYLLETKETMLNIEKSAGE